MRSIFRSRDTCRTERPLCTSLTTLHQINIAFAICFWPVTSTYARSLLGEKLTLTMFPLPNHFFVSLLSDSAATINAVTTKQPAEGSCCWPGGWAKRRHSLCTARERKPGIRSCYDCRRRQHKRCIRASHGKGFAAYKCHHNCNCSIFV